MNPQEPVSPELQNSSNNPITDTSAAPKAPGTPGIVLQPEAVTSSTSQASDNYDLGESTPQSPTAVYSPQLTVSPGSSPWESPGTSVPQQVAATPTTEQPVTQQVGFGASSPNSSEQNPAAFSAGVAGSASTINTSSIEPINTSTPGIQVGGPGQVFGPQPSPFQASQTPAFSSAPPKKSKRKLALIGGATGLLLALGISGYVFGYAIPNSPDNVWNTSLVRTGKAYDKLVAYGQTTKFPKTTTGHLSFQAKGALAADGTFDLKTSGQTSQLTGSISASGVKVGLDMRVLPSTGSTPDLYFKADGLQGIGSLLGSDDAAYTKALNGINNQWYVVDHTLFDQYASSSKVSVPTSKDVTDLLTAVGKSSKEYVFTSDTAKQAFVIKDEVGKESRDGRSVYHYKAGVNKSNLKAYVTALCGDVKDSKIGKAYDTSGDMINCTDAAKSVDTIKDSDSADVWVDLKTKLVHSVRITDKTNKASYFELAQNYTGGDEVPLKVMIHDAESDNPVDMQIGASVNMKTNTSSFTATLAGGKDQDKETATITGNLKPSNTVVKVDKPSNTKSIIELANDLGLGGALSSVDSTSSSDVSDSSSDSDNDIVRKNDIEYMASNMESFYADNNGRYPTLDEANKLQYGEQDPEGSSFNLVAAPTAHAYSYQPTSSAGGPCSASGTVCTKYTLTATLSTGKPYTTTN